MVSRLLSLKTDKGTVVHLMGIVKGLVSESRRVKERLKEVDFEKGALPISPEEVDALCNLIESQFEEGEYQLSTPEIAYVQNLKRFGEVRIPPPSYTIFLEYCTEADIEVEGIDMDDEHYTAAYCEHVSGINWIMQSYIEKRLLKKEVQAKTPREFAIEWDRSINRLSGFQSLEENRERVMAKNLQRLSIKSDVFTLIEYERSKGVLKILKDKGWYTY